MDKRSFIRCVRNWQANDVERALAGQPGLSGFRDIAGKTPLHHCAGISGADLELPISESVRTARALLRAGADVNADRVIIDDGEEFHARPLWYSVAWGKNFELSEFLLENGAEPVGCMWAACWAQDEEMAQLLRTFGAEVDAVFHDETPLLMLVKSKRFKLLRWLVDSGANINFQDKQGFSGLHYAIKRNHNLEQIDELLTFGADPTLSANDKSTPLSLAKRLGKTKVVALLQSHQLGRMSDML